METPKRIASFTVDHDYIGEGIYISRIDGDIVTYDMRTRKPNRGDYMDNLAMHSVEHMIATYMRNGAIKDNVIYFGPMGCQTGFYLLVRDTAPATVLIALKEALSLSVAHEGEIPGKQRQECGNYLNLDIEAAKRECKRYLAILNSKEWDFKYKEAL